MNFAALAALVTALAAACGGQQATGKNASSSAKGGDSSSGPTEPQLPSCEDGTCFSCGDGICPSGFYCETNKGVTGCAWVPSCVKTPSCDCVKPTLKEAKCTCEDRKGIAFATCGG